MMLHISHVPDGLEGFAVAEVAEAHMKAAGKKGVVAVYVARDDRRMAAMEQALRFFAPRISCLSFPAWDCVPYDRVSPNSEISARRMTALSRLAYGNFDGPVVLLTSINAVLQRVPSRSSVKNQSWSGKPGNSVDMDDLIVWLETNGFLRTPTVREHGEYAVRGGILDLFAPGAEEPVRLDFFGDTLESDPHLRCRDPAHHRPPAESHRPGVRSPKMGLTEDSIARFRQPLRRRVLAPQRAATTCTISAVSEGRRYQSAWSTGCRSFVEELEIALRSSPGDVPVALDPSESMRPSSERLDPDQAITILPRASQAMEAGDLERRRALQAARPRDRLYLDKARLVWSLLQERGSSGSIYRPLPCARGTEQSRSINGRARKRAQNLRCRAQLPASVNIFDALIKHIETEISRSGRRRVVIACWSDQVRPRPHGHQVLVGSRPHRALSPVCRAGRKRRRLAHRHARSAWPCSELESRIRHR